MYWMECAVHTTREAVETVSHMLHEMGATGVVIEDEESFGSLEDNIIVKAYFPKQKIAEKMVELKQQLATLSQYHDHIGRNEVTLTEIAEEDWAEAWKKYYQPTSVTDSLTIVPSWEHYEKKSGEHVIELDPGMAFGTGTHPTTILTLKALEKTIQGGESVIDVGTGSGILAIAAAKFGARNVLALDYDETAVKVAKENIHHNGVEHLISVQQNNLLTGITTRADIICANILAEVITECVEDAYRLLLPNGIFIGSGIIDHKHEEVERTLVAAGFTVKETDRMDDWILVIASKENEQER